MRCCIACGVVLSVLVARTPEAHAEEAAGADGAPTFAGLMARFAAMPGLEARFREERRSALVVEPLVCEGVLYYAPPGRLARRTLSPTPSNMVIAGGVLLLEEERGRRRIDLRSNPQVRQVVEGLLLLLSGDAAALERLYAVTFTPRPELGPAAWEMTLAPRSRPMRRAMRRVWLRGDDLAVRTMRIEEASGDETVTTFDHVDTARRYTDAELQRLFAVAAPGETPF
jgi:hypothetical protein